MASQPRVRIEVGFDGGQVMNALVTTESADGLERAFATFLGRMNASYREQLRDIVVMVAQDGQRAAAEYIVHGEYLNTDEGLPPANGQTYVLPGGAFFDIRDDRIARVTNYYNLQDWVRQVRRDTP